MLSFEEAEIALDEIAAELPPAIFDKLNGGYVLTPHVMRDAHGLYILGQYHVQPNGLGRFVTVHYGSICEVYSGISARMFREKLKFVLHHELTHHLESLAGDKSLEIQDEIDKTRYLGLHLGD
ncbi:MAG: hypothetical protein FWB96_13175 [Defluviitaleaceae bacterium]|nr:hypothetical protein [Defluviitaleaceae bacterium]MCL2264181.1 hypothetical protein [Defluviitaleaceae bacterium]